MLQPEPKVPLRLPLIHQRDAYEQCLRLQCKVVQARHVPRAACRRCKTASIPSARATRRTPALVGDSDVADESGRLGRGENARSGEEPAVAVQGPRETFALLVTDGDWSHSPEKQYTLYRCQRQRRHRIADRESGFACAPNISSRDGLRLLREAEHIHPLTQAD